MWHTQSREIMFEIIWGIMRLINPIINRVMVERSSTKR